MKSRLDILSDIYGEKETGSDRRKTSRKACTVCIQQRLRFQDGKILNEKFISVANKQLCNDMKRMKMLVESSTPPKFCNPSGWFQRTRLMPLHDRPPFTDFIVLYIPIRETSSEQDDAETEVGRLSEEIDSLKVCDDTCGGVDKSSTVVNSEVSSLSLLNMPEDILINFICKFLDPRSVVTLGRTNFSCQSLCISGFMLASLYECCTSYTNGHRSKRLEERSDRSKLDCTHKTFCYLMTHAVGFNDLFMRKLSSSSSSSRLVPTNLLKGIICLYSLSELFYYEKIMNSDANNYDDDANYKEKRKAVHRVVNLFENEFWKWDFGRLQKYMLKNFHVIDMLRDRKSYIDPLPYFKADHRLNDIFSWGSSFDELLRVLLSTRSKFVYSRADPDMHEQRIHDFSSTCFEYIKWIQKCRIIRGDYLLSINAAYILKRTKKQIFLLNEHRSKDLQEWNLRKSNYMYDKNSRYKAFQLASPAVVYGFESLQEVYDLLWPTSKGEISDEQKKFNLYRKRRRRSSFKRGTL
eukprot:g10477.t1